MLAVQRFSISKETQSISINGAHAMRLYYKALQKPNFSNCLSHDLLTHTQEEEAPVYIK